MVLQRLLAAACLWVWLLATACTDRDTGSSQGNVLSLDLGGSYRSLSQDLRTNKPKAKPKVVPPAPIRPLAPPTPRRVTPPRPEFVVIRLSEGQTLYGLCESKLGSGNRWREIAKFNGWSETEANQLKTGQTVKLPLR